jgi:molybdopterin converting factor subunit 1
MTVRVRLFAALRERAGRSELVWESRPGDTVADVWGAIRGAFPSLEAAGEHVAFAVNHEYVDRFHPLHDNDELAIIPPVSGGSSHVSSQRRRHRPGRSRTGGG